MRLDLAHLAEGAVEVHGIELVDRHPVGQQGEGEAGEGTVEQAARAWESLDVPEVGPALRPAVGEFVLAIDQIGAERIAGDAVFAHDVRRLFVAVSGVAFAVILIFMELGFLNALLESAAAHEVIDVRVPVEVGA